MQVTKLVREAMSAPRPIYSQREVVEAMRTIAGPARLVTVSGGEADAREQLRVLLDGLMRRNKDWSLVPLAELHERVTNRKAYDTASLEGFLETLYATAAAAPQQTRDRSASSVDLSAATLGYPDMTSFVRALSTSGRKITDAVQALSTKAKRTTVVMLDADSWPHKLLSELVRIQAHATHGDYRFVVFGAASQKLVPPGATHRVNAIELP